jgi:sensor histidine kinase YesM
LINSKKPLVSLEDELQMLRLYLEMERLRFKNYFSYRISFLNEIDADNVFIPPLLLQPFCENAIWHGLMNKDGEGMLQIDLEITEDSLRCTIAYNGIGIKKAAELKTKIAEKEKSMGLKITSDRLSLINQETDIQSFFKIEDLEDESGEPAGTKVMFTIRCSESSVAL